MTEDGQPRAAAKRVPLSRRLETIVELADKGNVVCDVGCDHAHVPIRLLQEEKFRSAIGMDILPGPLGKAAGNLKRYGMETRVALRQSDGLDGLIPGEADTIVITGMGGTLMREILLRSPAVTKSAAALVLGPQSDHDLVRDALRILGFRIAEERLLFEEGKYYPVLRAVNDGNDRITERGYSDAEAVVDGCAAERGYRDAKTSDDGCAADRGYSNAGTCGNGRGPVPFAPGIPAGICREAEDLFGPVLLRRRDPVLREYLLRKSASLKRIYQSVSRAAKEQPEAHSARRGEIEHSLAVYNAGLSVYGNGTERET